MNGFLFNSLKKHISTMKQQLFTFGLNRALYFKLEFQLKMHVIYLAANSREALMRKGILIRVQQRSLVDYDSMQLKIIAFMHCITYVESSSLKKEFGVKDQNTFITA